MKRDMELTPSERSGLLGWMLAHGDTFTAKEAAALVECHEDTARRILNRLARVLPIYEDGGVFQALVSEEEVVVTEQVNHRRNKGSVARLHRHCTPCQRR